MNHSNVMNIREVDARMGGYELDVSATRRVKHALPRKKGHSFHRVIASDIIELVSVASVTQVPRGQSSRTNLSSEMRCRRRKSCFTHPALHGEVNEDPSLHRTS